MKWLSKIIVKDIYFVCQTQYIIKILWNAINVDMKCKNENVVTSHTSIISFFIPRNEYITICSYISKTIIKHQT